MRSEVPLLETDRRAKRGLVSRQGAQGERSLRVVVLTAAVGEGHLAAARALVSELLSERSDVEVIVCDALVGLGFPLRSILLDAYRWQLRRAPWIFGLLYRTFAALAPLRALGRAVLALFGAGGLLRLLESYRPDIVVSTYPAAASVLGYLRRRGRLRVPAYATATDFAGLEFWAHPGIDLHLVMHESCLAPVERIAGPGSARLVRPLIAPAFLEPRSRDQARRALGLASCDRLVAVSGGGWGVGDLEGAVRAALELPAATIVCLTGRNGALQARLSEAFADEARVEVLGFSEQMDDLLAAADALVHSTGGVTCLEALARGCPIVAYGAPPGHAPLSAQAMASLGLLQSARSPSELVAALRRALAQSEAERPQLPPAPSAASLVLAAHSRADRAALWNAPGLRATVAVAAALVLVSWALLGDDAFAVVVRALDL